MTQNDSRYGRLIDLVGIAPQCPTEFAAFRMRDIENYKQEESGSSSCL